MEAKGFLAYRLEDYDYDLPPHLIAQSPCNEREASRMLVLHRSGGSFEHRRFEDLIHYLRAGDVLVLNDTQVVPARLHGVKESGGRIELLVTDPYRTPEQGTQAGYLCLVKSSKPARAGSRFILEDGTQAEVIGRLSNGMANVRFLTEEPLLNLLQRVGCVPLPPYIRREGDPTGRDDVCRYQTIYAREPGAVAAPTAGLHFSESLLNDLEARGVERVAVTLHVGYGTFAPIHTDDIREHRMHEEFVQVSGEAAAQIARAKGEGRRVIAVGTTVVRTLEWVVPSEMEEALRLDVRPVIYRLDHAQLWSDAARRLNRSAPVHVKVDTGMGRLGVPCAEAGAFLDELTTLPGIQIEGVLSHFAGADEADKSFCEAQLCRFYEALCTLTDRGRTVPYAHIANSAGLLDLPQAHYQLVRPGIMLYGSPPSNELHCPAELKPVMSFKAKVLQVKEVPKGQPIGYGRTYVTSRQSRIATLPVGYDDGYSRLLSNRGQVLVGGRRAPLVGRVSMNMITVDVTDVPGVKEDDEAVLLGAQGEERITAEEIARLCNTISYEIYCNFGRHRFKRFLNSTQEANTVNQTATGCAC